MFDKLRAMQTIGSLMKNKDQLEDAAQRVKAALDALRVEGEAGAGACRATVSGTMKVIDVTLEPALLQGMSVDEQTRSLAQSLIVEAVNNATENAQRRAKDIVAQEMRELGIEGLDPDMLSNASGLGGLLG